MNFKKLATTVAIVMVASLIPFGGSSASAAPSRTLTVDDNMVECRNAQYTSIQAAVTAASPGDTIKVCPGTYTEQVTIPASKNGLKLRSERKEEAIIKAPLVMADPKAIVRVNGATSVTIERFTISGPGGGPCDSIRYGVRVDGGGSASILDNHITMIRDTPFSGCQNGNAIQVGRQFEGQTGTATIRDNLIDDYQKSGIVVDNVGSSAEIDKNEIVGVGSTAITAQNGVQISRGATADVEQNDISYNLFAPQTFASAGVLVFETSDVVVSHNDISNNDESVYIIDTEGAVITHNDISDSTFDGIGLLGATNSEVSHNYSSNNGFDGIWVAVDSTDNSIHHNRMEDNAEHDAHDDSVGPGTGGTANTWEHNNCATDNRGGTLCDH